MSGGNVNITVVDGGSASIIVPGSSVQLVIGCCSTGTVGQLVATRSPATLQSIFGAGPLVEAAALTCLAGGTVIACRATTTTPGVAGTVTKTGTGTSVITVTGTPVDTYYVKFLVTLGGTIGTGPISFQISLDAGRNYGPVISLGTANTYLIPGTGITLNFAAGTLVTNDTATFGTTEPLWNTAGSQAAINAFQASQYAVQGVGSTHIVGTMSGASCTTVEGYLDTLANNFVYTRSFMSARDASPPSAYSGTGESEATWIGSLQTDYAAVAARRACVGAGHWNMPSAFPSPSAFGAPALRRPIAWAAAAKQVTLPPQRHNGRPKDGSVSQIVVNAASDPLDGFVYHDERINGGLDYIITGSGSRFMTTMTRTGLPGVFITNPLTQAPLGSDFFLMPFGSVMDVFCSIMNQQGQLIVDDDLRINANGTIFENDARAVESALASAANSILFAQKMISQPIQAGPSAAPSSSIVVDRTTNVRATSTLNISGNLVGKAYALTLNLTLSYLNPGSAV